MDTLILVALFTAILISVIMLVAQLLLRRQRARQEWEAAGRPEAVPPSPEERERDRRTSLVWGCLAVAVPLMLLAAYWLTR